MCVFCPHTDMPTPGFPLPEALEHKEVTEQAALSSIPVSLTIVNSLQLLPTGHAPTKLPRLRLLQQKGAPHKAQLLTRLKRKKEK